MSLEELDFDPFADEGKQGQSAPTTPASAPASDLEPLDFDPLATDDGFVDQVAQNIVELGKGVASGAVKTVGTALKGRAGLKQGTTLEAQNLTRDLVDRVLSVSELTDEEQDQLYKDIRRSGLPLEVREELARGFIDARTKGAFYEPSEKMNKLLEPLAPVSSSRTFQAGQAVQEFGEELAPPAKGYEESPGRLLGEGLGSMATGLAGSVVGGPVLAAAIFALAGSGEAIDRAVRAGATEDQIVAAARRGLIPGLTDSVPVEVLLGRIPIAGKFIKVPANMLGRVLRRIGRVGLQAFVEGVQEGGQEFLQNLIAKEIYKPDQSLTEGVLPSAGVGAGVGAIAETGKQLLRGFAGRRRGAAPGPVAPDLQPGDIESPIPTDLIAEGRRVLNQPIEGVPEGAVRAEDVIGSEPETAAPRTGTAAEVASPAQATPAEPFPPGGDGAEAAAGNAPQAPLPVLPSGESPPAAAGSPVQAAPVEPASTVTDTPAAPSQPAPGAPQALPQGQPSPEGLPASTRIPSETAAPPTDRGAPAEGTRSVFAANFGSARQQNRILTGTRNRLRRKLGGRLSIHRQGKQWVMRLKEPSPADAAAIEKELNRQTQIAIDRSERAKARGAPRKAGPMGLAEAIARAGGIVDYGGELKSRDLDTWHRGKPGMPKLVVEDDRTSTQALIGGGVTANTRTLDYRREWAIERGYLPEGATVDDLIEALAGDRPVTEQGAEARQASTEAVQADREAQAREEIRAYAREIGEPLGKSDIDAILQHVVREGIDAEAAVFDYAERLAIQAETEAEEATGNADYDPIRESGPPPAEARRDQAGPEGAGQDQGEGREGRPPDAQDRREVTPPRQDRAPEGQPLEPAEPSEEPARGDEAATRSEGPTRPLYVYRPVTNAKAILLWAKAQGFKTTLPADELHVTVAHSSKAMDWDAVEGDAGTVAAKGGKRSVEALGDKGAVVLKFSGQQLEGRWKAYRDAGASWDFEGYQPHITITYDKGDVDLEKVTPYRGPINLGPETKEDVVEDATADLEEVPTGAATEDAPARATVPAEDADEQINVSFTATGPWDFNDTFPRPDPENNAGRAREGRDYLDEQAEPQSVVATIQEWINEAAPMHTQMGALRDEKAHIEGGGKPRVKRPRKRGSSDAEHAEAVIDWLNGELASAESEHEDWRNAALDYFDEAAIDAMDAEARRMALGPKTAPAAAPAVTSEPTEQGEQEVIPGAERIGTREQVERGMQGRSRARTEQRGLEGLDLFDAEARAGAQDDIFDRPELGAADTTIPAPSNDVEKRDTPRKRTRKPKGPDILDRLENYFRPGRIVPSYGGRDKVIAFERTPGEISPWQVRVQEVDQDGNVTGPERTHSTVPRTRDLEAWERESPVPVPAAPADTGDKDALAAYLRSQRDTSADTARQPSGRPLNRLQREAYLAGYDRRVAEIEGTEPPPYDAKFEQPALRRVFERGAAVVGFHVGQSQRGAGPAESNALERFSLAPSAPRRFGIPPEAGEPISSYTSDQGIKIHRDYKAAKAGDAAAAARMVAAVVKPETVAEARRRFGSDVIYAPVIAQEASGRNKIPELVAHYYAESTGAQAVDVIVQASTAYHTGAKPLERIVSRPLFDGPVEPGRRYVLVDDVTVMGGTLAELANHIRANGGEVAGVVTLVNASRSGIFAPNPRHLRLLEERLGDEIRNLGIEPRALTADEVKYLIGFRDAAQFRDSVAKARSQRDQRLRAKGLRPPAPEDDGRLRTGAIEAEGPLRATFNFTPEWNARREAVYADLRAALDRMGLAGVNLRLPDSIDITDATGEAVGFASGHYLRDMIDVSLAAPGDPARTLRHEAIHALRDMNVIRRAEWRTLSRAAEADAERLTGVRQRYAAQQLTEDQLVEETVGDMYGEWFDGEANPRGFIRTAFERIRAFIEALGNALRGNGFRAASDVFAAIERGEIGSRPPLEGDGAGERAGEGAAQFGSEITSPPLAAEEDGPRFSLRPPEVKDTRGRKTALGRMLRDGAPIDRAFRLPFDIFGGLTETGEWKPGAGLFQGARKILTEAKFSDEGRFAWLNRTLHVARAGLIDRYGLPTEYAERERKRSRDERAVMLEGVEILKTLKDQDVSVEEAKILQDVLTGEAIPDERWEKLAVPIRQAIDQLGQEAVSLGLLSRESYERNRGTYLHRVYMKHEAEQDGLSRWVGKMMGRNRKKIIGDQFKGRGMFLEVDHERILRDLPGYPDAERGQLVKGEAMRILDAVDETGDLPETGDTIVRPQRRIFWPAETPVPEHLQGLRDRGVWEVRFIGRNKVTLWRDFTRDERESMGEIMDARYTIGKTFMMMAHDLATGRFYKDIAENGDWSVGATPNSRWVDAADFRRVWSDETVEWVRVPDTNIPDTGGKKRYGALAGRWVRASIWRDINELDILNRPTLWTKLLTQWKLNKALALDTPIPTPTGWTTMGEIKVGDRVFDEKGKVCTVLGVRDVQHGRPCYEVAFSDGTKIIADDEHWWFTLMQGKGGVRTTAEIRATLKERTRGDNRHSIPVAGALELPEVDLPIPPYALGIWLGDGDAKGPRVNLGGEDLDEIMRHLTNAGVHCTKPSKDKRNNVHAFTLQRKPGRCIRGHDDKYRNPVNCGKCEREAKAAKAGGSPMSPIINAPLPERLDALGVRRDKHIPALYLRASESQRRELLMGLIDSDGCITEKGESIFVTSIPKLRDGFLELARSLGYKPAVRERQSVLNGVAKKRTAIIYFRAYAEKPVARLARKASRLKPEPKTAQRSRTRQIVSITPVPSVPVRCIEVSSESHLYLAGGGMIPTHNTARSPVVHMNNVMSNMVLMDLADIGTGDFIAGVRAYATGSQDYEEATANGAFGADMISQEVRRNVLEPLLKELQDDVLGAQGAVEGRIGMLGKLADRIWSIANATDKKMIDLYRLEDEVFRMATYMRRRQLGDTPEAAASFARDQFLDYDIRAPWVNIARRSVLPFASYVYRAAPIIAKSLAEHPWKLAKYFTIAYALNALSYLLEPGDEDEERRSIREEEQGYTWIGTPRMLRMPWRDAQGNPVFLDIRRWIPAGDIFDIGQGSSAIPFPAPLLFGGPLMLGAELMLNRSAFTGRDIVNERTDDAWDRTGKIGDWAWKSWMPSAAWVPGSWYWAAIGRAMEGARDYAGRPYSLPQAVSSSFGVKIKPQDVEQNFANWAREFNRIERDLRFEMRTLGRDRERGLISTSAFRREQDRLLRKFRNLATRRQEILDPRR